MSEDAPTQTLPTATSAQAALPLSGFAAGITGAALVVAGVWGFHVLTPGGGAAGSVGWVVLLCLAFTALGKGITLLRRALTPVTAAVLAPLAPISAPVRATAGIVIGATGIWWVMRGHAATWWTHTTGTSSTTAWTLTSQLVAVAFMVVFGALLFGGAKTLATAIFANSGTRQRDNNAAAEQRWALWWSSHPGLGLTLLAGAAALVFLSGYVVPRVSAWLTGDDPMAALAAIAAILTVAFFANTWWWKALSGWWTWAHTHGSGGGGASPLGQMHAGAAVIALIWFSAMGFGLASPQDYTGPGAAPLAHAQCPPDCGGGSNGSNSYGPDASQFQPPQMPAQQPDYQGGINQPPLDQNSGISIYNQNPAQGGQTGPQQAGQNIGQQPGQRAAHGEPLPNYGPWQPDAQPPAQAPQPVQQAPAQQPSMQQPAQSPQNPAPPQPAQQPPQQPVQQAPQQQPGAQQQPQQVQKQPGQAPPTQPDAPKKTAVDPTDLAVAATRRGSQQAGQQAAQQGTAQAVSKNSQIATQMSGTATNMNGPAPMEPPTPSPSPAQPGGNSWGMGDPNSLPPLTPPPSVQSVPGNVPQNPGALWNPTLQEGPPPTYNPSPSTTSPPKPGPAQPPTPSEAEQAVVDRSDQAKWLADWNKLQAQIAEHNMKVAENPILDRTNPMYWQLVSEAEELKAELLPLQADALRMGLPDVPIADLQRPGK